MIKRYDWHSPMTVLDWTTLFVMVFMILESVIMYTVNWWMGLGMTIALGFILHAGISMRVGSRNVLHWWAIFVGTEIKLKDPMLWKRWNLASTGGYTVEHNEMTKWLNENVGKSRYYMKSVSTLIFMSKGDAVRFKLSWNGV